MERLVGVIPARERWIRSDATSRNFTATPGKGKGLINGLTSVRGCALFDACVRRGIFGAHGLTGSPRVRHT
eukprot:3739778-Prymnesium_polylepis.2